ncbi:hypothetical protein PAMP_019116 [Pampus punctatissimus]
MQLNSPANSNSKRWLHGIAAGVWRDDILLVLITMLRCASSRPWHTVDNISSATTSTPLSTERICFGCCDGESVTEALWKTVRCPEECMPLVVITAAKTCSTLGRC